MYKSESYYTRIMGQNMKSAEGFKRFLHVSLAVSSGGIRDLYEGLAYLSAVG